MTRINRIIIISSIFLISISSACWPFGDDCETVNTKSIFFNAYREPENFDDNVSALDIQSGTSKCLKKLSDESFQNEQDKLLECSVILSGTPAWNECHDEAASFSNQGVILLNIANTVDGKSRFDTSSGGTFLILSKSLFSEADWISFVAVLEDLTPEMTCEICD